MRDRSGQGLPAPRVPLKVKFTVARTRVPADAGIYPTCSVCRDGTYATASLQTHDDPEWPWTHYCDRCGEAMASVIRDGYQKRDPVKRRLPDPPAGTKAPDPSPEKKIPRAAKTTPPVTPPAKPAPKPSFVEHDLLDLLGWKK